MFSNVSSIASFDSELHEAIKSAENRPEPSLEQHASESYAVRGVPEAPETVFYKKSPEGQHRNTSNG